jgi:hypothetical protein
MSPLPFIVAILVIAVIAVLVFHWLMRPVALIELRRYMGEWHAVLFVHGHTRDAIQGKEDRVWRWAPSGRRIFDPRVKKKLDAAVPR